MQYEPRVPREGINVTPVHPLREAATLTFGIAAVMALLVAQSRVEAGIHSVVETLAGAVLGTCVTIVIFQLWG